VLVAGCAGTPDRTPAMPPPVERPRAAASCQPVLEAHLGAEWMATASRVLPAGAIIYYHGTAQRGSPEGEPWTGTVRGDVLMLSPDRAVVIPKGTLTVDAHGSIRVDGAHCTVLAGAKGTPGWGGLLAR